MFSDHQASPGLLEILVIRTMDLSSQSRGWQVWRLKAYTLRTVRRLSSVLNSRRLLHPLAHPRLPVTTCRPQAIFAPRISFNHAVNRSRAACHSQQSPLGYPQHPSSRPQWYPSRPVASLREGKCCSRTRAPTSTTSAPCTTPSQVLRPRPRLR